jgi:hypothetical protein
MTVTVKSDVGGTVGSIQVNGTDSAMFQAGQSYPKSGILTDAATVTWAPATQGQIVTLTTTAARTMGAPTTIIENAMYMLILKTGGFTPSWHTSYKWASGEAPSGLENATYVFSFIGGASNLMIPTGPGFKTGA